MANHLVDGVLVPDAVAGSRALELANTRAGWGAPSPREYLVSPDALAVWAGDVGLLTPRESIVVRSSRPDPAALAAAIDLREALYDVLVGPCTSPALEAVRSATAQAWDASTLVRTDHGIRPDGGAPTGWLPVHRAALAVADLLGAGDAPYVRACGGRGCGWLFLDRAQRRRWCIMAVCGNRAKARAYASRHRA